MATGLKQKREQQTSKRRANCIPYKGKRPHGGSDSLGHLFGRFSQAIIHHFFHIVYIYHVILSSVLFFRASICSRMQSERATTRFETLFFRSPKYSRKNSFFVGVHPCRTILYDALYELYALQQDDLLTLQKVLMTSQMLLSSQIFH